VDEAPCRIDWDTVLKAVDSRRELLSELIDLFFVEYPALLKQIRTAVAESDAAALRLAAHRLKGCLRYFGENQAAEFALQLELRGRDDCWEGVPEMLAGLQTELERLLPAIRDFRP
jgi:HPt (histidine-containing phosphotransfer) domain-containing protein